MPVFFIHSTDIHDDILSIPPTLSAHLYKSLRIRQGDTIKVGDEQRRRYLVKITHIESSQTMAQILDTQSSRTPTSPTLILGQAILKGDRMNWAIQKATELGVSTIIPVLSARVVVRLESRQARTHQERWQRIALEAAQQAERWEVPTIKPPCQMRKFLSDSTDSDVKSLLVERQADQGITAIEVPAGPERRLTLAVGPEGGWTQDEILAAQECGFRTVSLGPRILRAETAALASLTILQSRLGQLG